MFQSEHNITDKSQWTHEGVLLDRGNGKALPSAGIRPSSGFGSIQVRFRKSDQKHVFHPISVGIPRVTHSSSASSLTPCYTEQVCSIKQHARVQNLAQSTARKAYTIAPSRPCLSARRRGFPRTKTRLLYIVNRTFGEQPYWWTCSACVLTW